MAKSKSKETGKTVEKKNKKTNKRRHLIGRKEFLFNFFSLVFALVVVLYFGGRCFYYYSLQSMSKKETEMTLNGLLLDNNKLVKSGDGLYKTTDSYFFKGKVESNYVWFANRMFRVLEIGEDNTVKLVSNDLVSMFMWGEDTSYDKSNLKVWLTDSKDEQSGVYYNSIPNPDFYMTKTKYTIDNLNKDKVKSGKKEYKDNVVSLTLSDYVRAGGKESFLNNSKVFYLLGYTMDNENLYVEEDGSIMSCDKLDSYGVRSVITLKKNTNVSQGDGSVNNPYTIDMGNNNNYVDSYVKLGDDIWKVYNNKDNVLKMYLNGYIMNNGTEVLSSYSKKDNHFNYYDRTNIGYYLLNNYYANLPYKDVIVSNSYPLGEVSVEEGYNYLNIYKNNFEGYISMLNLFDYVSNNELSDFYRNNSTSTIGNVQYVTFSNGIVEEVDIKEEKKIVPVISINASILKGGSGRIDDPYVMG